MTGSGKARSLEESTEGATGQMPHGKITQLYHFFKTVISRVSPPLRDDLRGNSAPPSFKLDHQSSRGEGRKGGGGGKRHEIK